MPIMKEEYLHYLWRVKKVPFNKFFLTDGRPLEVLNFGWYNHDSGPDFFNGQIKIDNLLFSGNIELHVKSSDWYLHQHQFDENYNNVILHVVYEHDKDVFVNGQKIPTLEIGGYVDQVHYDKYLSVKNHKSEFPCGADMTHYFYHFREQLDNVLFQRLYRKADGLISFSGEASDFSKLLFDSFIKSFGGRANAAAFEMLAANLNHKIFLKESWCKERVEAIVFGVAGFLDDDIDVSHYKMLVNEWELLKRKYNLSSMSLQNWKTSGMRPWSHPVLKLAQLSGLLKKWSSLIGVNWFELIEDVEYLRKLVTPDLGEFWFFHFNFKSNRGRSLFKWSDFQSDLVIINGLVPYLMGMNLSLQKQNFDHGLLNLLENLNPELNVVTKKYLKNGFKCESIADSQAILEQYQSFCKPRNCLNCKVGHKVFEKNSIFNDFVAIYGLSIA